uniref:Uncharacterized protein n=1 Tax=Oryza punctata TaxID=4537 RepID=A0A0E0LBB4_ORYPU
MAARSTRGRRRQCVVRVAVAVDPIRRCSRAARRRRHRGRHQSGGGHRQPPLFVAGARRELLSGGGGERRNPCREQSVHQDSVEKEEALLRLDTVEACLFKKIRHFAVRLPARMHHPQTAARLPRRPSP